MKIIFLPGLDGTGLLFDRLIEQFPESWNYNVVSYNSIKAESYLGQAKEIAARINDKDIFVVAESYSGRVAYELYHLLSERVKGIVFLASFISRPSQIARLAKFLPVFLLKPNFLTKLILYLFGFNLSGDKGMVIKVFDSLQKSDKLKLRSRLYNIATMPKAARTVECPVTYVRPSTDFLVSSSAVKLLASKSSKFNLVEVNGGHFIAQSNPAECAQIIRNAINHLNTQ